MHCLQSRPRAIQSSHTLESVLCRPPLRRRTVKVVRYQVTLTVSGRLIDTCRATATTHPPATRSRGRHRAVARRGRALSFVRHVAQAELRPMLVTRWVRTESRELYANARRARSLKLTGGRCRASVVYMRRCPRDALAESLAVVPRLAQPRERVRRRRRLKHTRWGRDIADRLAGRGASRRSQPGRSQAMTEGVRS